MTEAEALELALMASSNGVTTFTVFITFTLAYLVTAFAAGQRLTRARAGIASILYIFAASSALLNMVSDLDYSGAMLQYSPTLRPAGALNSHEFWRVYMVALLSLGMVASLNFMWTIRHPRTN